MVLIKYFDEFEGVYKDITGTTGQTLRFDAYGNLDNQLPQWGDIGGSIGAQADLKNELQGLVALNTWVDYSSTSTITGFNTYTTKLIQYLIIGKTMVVQFVIAGNGTNGAHTFTLPYSGSTWGQQFFTIQSLNNNTTQAIGVASIPASSNVLTISNTASTTATWTNNTTQAIRGTIIVNI